MADSLKLVLQVLTLRNENSWKMIEDRYNHFSINCQIYISAVLYYEAYAYVDIKNPRKTLVMSFDVSSEEFHHIERHVDSSFDCYPHMMIMYEGKLAMMPNIISRNGSFVLWVLEDEVKHEWLKKSFVLPNSWMSLAQSICTPSGPSHEFHEMVNFTDAGEFIVAPMYLCQPPFYVPYYI